MYTRRKLKFPILVAGDVLIVYASLFAALWVRNPDTPFPPADLNNHLIPFTILFAIWILTYASSGLYEVSITKNEMAFTKRLAKATIVNAIIAIVLFYSIPLFQITPRANLFLVLIFSAAGIFIWRHIFNGIIARANADRVLFFGISSDTAALAAYLRENPQYAFQPVVFVSLGEESALGLTPTYPFRQNLSDLVRQFSVDTIVASKDIADDKLLAQALFEILPLGVRFIDFPIFYEMITGKIPVSRINELWFLENFVRIKNTSYETIKRILDVVFAVLLCIPLAIAAPCIALAITLDSRGPALYRQQRIGKGGRGIEIIKFRSMVSDAERGKALWADENDPRVTRVGSFLRKTRLDELPQIWNVLRGDISFIGPRPERPEFVARLEKTIPFYQMRHVVSPGLTGWAQINFPYGSSVSDAMEKLQYDLYYIKHRSLVLDMDILLRTILVVISGAGR